jgi:DNA-binding transcriptional LysR family regulator
MDIDHARTFLAVVANGSFLDAAKHLHVTQSTVSARIQRLEADLGVVLFVRNRAGASLTTAGRRFLQHAKTLVLTLEQARHELGLPDRYRAGLRVGGRIALWEGFLPRWVGWMHDVDPRISIRSEIGFEDDLMRRLIEGTLDIGLMYSPSHAPGLLVEHLFDETLVLVGSRPDVPWPDPDYVYVEWGQGFYAKHLELFPDLERPPRVANIGWLGVQLVLANGGSCFLPLRIARPMLEAGRLFRAPGTPTLPHPAYMVLPRDHGSVIELAARGLRVLAEAERPGPDTEQAANPD